MKAALDWFLVALALTLAAWGIWADIKDMRAASRYAAAKRQEREQS